MKRYVAVLDEQGNILKFKRNTVTCYCSAYPFPHRLGSGLCAIDKPGFYQPEGNDSSLANQTIECNQKDYGEKYEKSKEKSTLQWV